MAHPADSNAGSAYSTESRPPSAPPAVLSESDYAGLSPLPQTLSVQTLGQRSESLAYGNLELRPEEYQALVDGRRIGLTMREFQVLHALAQQEDRVVRRAEIYRRVWGGEMKHRERAVDVFVRKVRNKLFAAAPGWTYIHTHFGIGYRFAPEGLDGVPEHPDTS
jgi:DNA-binding response OmpR family regulator